MVCEKQLFHLLGVFSFLLTIGLSPVVAQNDELPEPIYSGAYPQSWSWSADSTRFVFTNGIESPEVAVEFNEPDWFQYDVSSKTLSRHTVWPLQPMLTSAEQSTFDPWGGGFIFESPDKRNLVYAGTNIYEGTLWHIKIADQQNQQATYLPDWVTSPTSGTDDFNVIWSADNTAFVISSVGEMEDRFLTYVNGYRPGLDTSATTYIDDLLIDNRSFLAQEAYDISDDGRFVLLNAPEETDLTLDQYNLPLKIIIWDSSSPSASRIIDNVDGKQVTGASFSPDDSGNLLLATDEGLLKYDLVTGNSTLLNPNIKGSHVIFSPDAQYAAVIADGGAISIVKLNNTTSGESLSYVGTRYIVSATSRRTG